MKLEIDTGGGLTLSEVFSGVGVKTDMGLFGIAQRDGGIEVLLDGKTVWTSHEIEGTGGSKPTVPGKVSKAEEVMVFGATLSDEDRPEIDRYMARVCLCGRPRSEHFYGCVIQPKTKRTPEKSVVSSIMSGRCNYFTDAVERKLGIERCRTW